MTAEGKEQLAKLVDIDIKSFLTYSIRPTYRDEDGEYWPVSDGDLLPDLSDPKADAVWLPHLLHWLRGNGDCDSCGVYFKENRQISASVIYDGNRFYGEGPTFAFALYNAAVSARVPEFVEIEGMGE